MVGVVLTTVMPGLVPDIHVFGRCTKEDVDGRDKAGPGSGRARSTLVIPDGLKGRTRNPTLTV